MKNRNTTTSAFTIRNSTHTFTIILFISIFCLIAPNNAKGQNIGINPTGAAPDGTAILDVASTNKGILIPRVSLLSTTDVATITTPTTSLVVYNTNATMTNGTGVGFYTYTGSAWVPLIQASNSPGASGQVLTSKGNATPPQWEATSSGGGGGGGYSSSCHTCPTQMTNSTTNFVYQGTAVKYCRDLVSGGFSDWRLPSLAEMKYLVETDMGGATDPTYDYENWTTTVVLNDVPAGNQAQYYLTMNPRDGEVSTVVATNFGAKTRCVR